MTASNTSEYARHYAGKAVSLGRQSWQLMRLFKVLFLEFRGFFITVVVTSLMSTLLLYYCYPEDLLPNHHRSFALMAYNTMLMTFFENPINFVDDPRLAPVFFGLPILGLLVIAEGVVHLGQLLIHRKRYSKEWQKMIAATYDNHIIVCGLGNVGFRVVEQLRLFGEEVVAIETKTMTAFIREVESWRVPIIDGDATNMQALEMANLKKAKAVIAVTDNDLANLEIGLNARELKPGIRVVLRMFDQKLAKKIEKSFDISCAFSASALSAPVFAQAALSRNILSSFDFAGTTINAFQLVVDAKHGFVGMQIDELRHKFEVTVLMHERQQQLDWNPPPSTVLQVGDRVLIMTDSRNVRLLVESEN